MLCNFVGTLNAMMKDGNLDGVTIILDVYLTQLEIFGFKPEIGASKEGKPTDPVVAMNKWLREHR